QWSGGPGRVRRGDLRVALSNLGEDPFDRLRAVRAATSLPLHGLIRGQALVGNRPLPDDVMDRFVATVAGLGLDVFRCFDPLNDVRNLARVVEAVRAAGKVAEAALVYTESPVHSNDGFVRRGGGSGWDGIPEPQSLRPRGHAGRRQCEVDRLRTGGADRPAGQRPLRHDHGPGCLCLPGRRRGRGQFAGCLSLAVGGGGPLCRAPRGCWPRCAEP
ncbi:pyruvate carboxylase subunit B, partial [mine drainage metagenome]